jgi:hypothetical protein
MRPARTTRVIAAVLFAISLLFLHVKPTRVTWYVRSDQASGIEFIFDAPKADFATVTVSGMREAKAFTVTQTISTGSDGKNFIPLETGRLDQFEVKVIKIEILHLVFVFENPKPATPYTL